MRAIFGLVLIVGVALAGGAVMMAKNYIAAYDAALAEAQANAAHMVETTEIFVAARPLQYGEILTEDAVQAVAWPANALPEGSFGDLATLFPDSAKGPRMVLRAMEPNEPLMAVKITEPGEDAGLTSRLARGMRAFAVNVDVASGVSGLLRPGDRVDVYWTGSTRQVLEGSGGGEVARLIEAGVELVAIDQSVNKEIAQGAIARTVTVAVRPEQVAALALAQSTGRLTLALVGANDDTVAQSIEVDQRALLGIGAYVPAAEPAQAKVCSVRTRRGAEVVEIPIPCSN